MTSRGIFIARTLQGELCFDRHPQLPVGSKLGDRFEGDDAGWKHAEPLRLQVAAYRLRPHDGRLVFAPVLAAARKSSPKKRPARRHRTTSGRLPITSLEVMPAAFTSAVQAEFGT
jgi:hypothetical protein